MIDEFGFLLGSGIMEEKIRNFDWTGNPLGPVSTWPRTLCNYISLTQSSKIPMIVVWGPEFILIPNEAIGINGYHKRTYGEFLGKRGEDYYQQSWKNWKVIFDQVTKSGQGFIAKDFALPNPDASIGPKSYWDFQISPLQNDMGLMGGFLFVAVESTEKILYARKLEDTQKIMGQALEAAQMGTYEYNLNSQNIITSDRCKEIFGVYEELAHNGFLDHILREDYPIRQKAMEEFRKTGLVNYEVRIRRKGEIIWIQTDGKYYHDVESNLEKIVGTVLDITEKKKAEDNLKKTNTLLEQSLNEQRDLQKLKDEFLQVASHELKAPLTSIKGFAQLAEEVLLENGHLEEGGMLGKLNQKIEHLHFLVKNLFDVSKVNSGNLEFNSTYFQMKDLLKMAVEDSRFMSPTHTFLEDYSFNALVYADKDRIMQVLTNLISNAIKYSPDRKEIQIRTRPLDHYLVVDIIDQGIGIPEEEQDKIFGQFYRSKILSATSFRGIGLGLYISQQIIIHERGSMWVESTLGKGSIFSFSLPFIENPD